MQAGIIINNILSHTHTHTYSHTIHSKQKQWVGGEFKLNSSSNKKNNFAFANMNTTTKYHSFSFADHRNLYAFKLSLVQTLYGSYLPFLFSFT